ncbi:3-phosphoshikimate 1-carboxyvinyltransferase [Gryllotalpicola reticulitermitis]|uniref:3-phosphoshikimate 1-carboxyvinyltransferase n=1 Tax=Gryllotalpicola reticulitermitis TaxID=1184153 RepID=A0ABV8Q5V0_9MICO
MQLISRGTTHKLVGTLDIPVSKYHAHRALVLAALAEGVSTITGISSTRQVEWTVSVLRALGTKIEITDAGYIVTGTGGRFHGVPLNERGSRGEEGLLNVGSSGTTLYFMTGLASLSDRPTTLTGMKYFRRRPIKALLSALIEMGLDLESTNDCPPITVQPKRPKGGDVHIAGTLSQWVSGLLLTAPFAESDTTIHITGGQLNEQPYVDLTIRMMRHWGFEVEVSDDWLTYTVKAGQTGTAADYTIPADIGSAAFGIAAAALHPSDVLFKGLRAATTAEVDHPEAEFLDIAASMGVPMVIDEATGWVRITHDGLALTPFDIDATPIPDLLPILSVMANFAEGTSHLRNVGHIRLKESDRVAAMLQLNKMGGDVTQEPTELHISGVAGARGTGARLSSFNDHRVLMSLAIAGTRSDGETSLTYPRAYRISYPTFLEAMTSIGLDIDVDAPSKDAAGDDEEATTQASAPLSAEPLVLPIAVREYAETKTDEAAVIEVGGSAPITTTWGTLQAEADKVSQLLLELGVEKGEAVGVQLPNWTEFVSIALGVMQIGAVVTPIMPVFGPREVAMTLSRSRARVLFLPNLFRNRRASVELVSVADEAHQQGRKLHLEHVIVLQAENRDGGESVSVPPIPEEAVTRAEAASWTWRYYENALGSVEPDRALIADRMPGADDICQLLFTSGTTGEPKGVQHPYRTLGLATAMHVQRSGLTADDRVFIPSPLAHQTGFLYGMLLAWRLGVASVIQPVWNGEVALDQAFGEAKASFVQAATPFLTDLVALVEGGHAAPDALRIFVATGAAVPRELARKATTVLDTAVLGAFGTTETCLGTLASPNDQPESMWGTDGRVLDGIRLRIVDDEGVELPVGTEGNYEFTSPTLFGGYLERPDLTADVFTDDGWYKTGDLAYVDEQGYLHITGRVKDVINRGGEKIPVVEIENLLYQHPLVSDIAIVAMPDPRLGERACAFVVSSRAGEVLEFGAMQDYLNSHGVSKYYWPERLEYIDELPRNAVGKIQKNVLRETAAGLAAASKEGN